MSQKQRVVWRKMPVSELCACLAFLSILCSFNLCRFLCSFYKPSTTGKSNLQSHPKVYSIITFYYFFSFLSLNMNTSSKTHKIKTPQNFSSDTYFIFWRSSCALAKAASAALALCSACFNCSRSTMVSLKPSEGTTFTGSQRSSMSDETGTRIATSHVWLHSTS